MGASWANFGTSSYRIPRCICPFDFRNSTHNVVSSYNWRDQIPDRAAVYTRESILHVLSPITRVISDPALQHCCLNGERPFIFRSEVEAQPPDLDDQTGHVNTALQNLNWLTAPGTRLNI